MIDFELVERSTEYSVERLAARQSTVCPDLALLDDFLHPELLSKLYDFVSTYPDSEWGRETDQEHRNRLKLNWVPESVIEETWMVMANLTPTVNQLFNRTDEFIGISIWKDRETYKIDKHIDNPLINIALQVYLSPESGDFATKFEHEGIVLSATYKQNSGYLLSGPVVHFLSNPVTKQHTRYSLYAIWRQ